MDLEVGDVIQIDPESDDRFAGCLMIVTEPKTWGAQGYVSVPNPGCPARAFYRCKKENFVRIGHAEWMVQ